MRLTIIFLLVFCAGLSAQTTRTDTVKPGFYIPLDSNVVSCKVGITPAGKSDELFNMTGNKLSPETITKIGALPLNSLVVYSEITVLNNGKFEKSTTIRYVIGSQNSVPAREVPLVPDTLHAADIAQVVLDVHVYNFHVTYATGGAYYDYEQNGNGISQDIRERIAALPSGTRVWFESIKRKEDDGTLTTAPAKVYVVK